MFIISLQKQNKEQHNYKMTKKIVAVTTMDKNKFYQKSRFLLWNRFRQTSKCKVNLSLRRKSFSEY